jgi:hypothetical protein
LDLPPASTAPLLERAGAAESGAEEEVASGRDLSLRLRLHSGECDRWRWEAPQERGSRGAERERGSGGAKRE